MLLIITAALGGILIVYSLFRYLTGIGLNEALEKQFMDIIFFSALVIFIYNRKLARDEKKAKEAEEESKRQTVENQEEIVSLNDSNNGNDYKEIL